MALRGWTLRGVVLLKQLSHEVLSVLLVGNHLTYGGEVVERISEWAGG
jgi:hypothetical protein